MFTGIIEEIGKIKSVTRESRSIRLTVAVDKILKDIKIGDSICTNGVCLTVTSFDSSSFCADVMPETMDRTAFRYLKVNDPVNIERAMPANGRFGGHIVSGHIDGTGIITNMTRDDRAIRITIETEPEIARGIVEKGSIAIDGISLTVIDVTYDKFGVSIIEHTQHMTTLSNKKVGDTVNLENDIIGKYIEKFIGFKTESNNNDRELLDLLMENGF
ncbi:MAG: riboflavin synthase [Candidatus Limimorpha sp.]